jgi:hypothetical protein
MSSAPNSSNSTARPLLTPEQVPEYVRSSLFMLNKSLKFLDLPDEDLQFLASSPESAFTANLIAVTYAAHQRLESKLQQQQSHLSSVIQVKDRIEEQLFDQKGIVQ